MVTVTTHQSSFLPYSGYWWKMLKSDRFLVNGASEFTRQSMYYRTYAPKSSIDDLDYFTVGYDRKNTGYHDAIRTVKLRPDTFTVLRKRLEAIFGLYKKHCACRAEYEELRDHFLTLCDVCEDNVHGKEPMSLFQLNYHFEGIVLGWLRCNTRVDWNLLFPGTSDNKSTRLAQQLSAFYEPLPNQDVVYLSGQAGWDYIDEDVFKQTFNADIFYQFPTDKFKYEGFILHHMLTVPRDELPGHILEQFELRTK